MKTDHYSDVSIVCKGLKMTSQDLIRIYDKEQAMKTDYDNDAEHFREDVHPQPFFQLVEPRPNWWQRWRQYRKLHRTKYIWQAVSIGGQSSFYTQPLVREKAIAYICGRGNVLLVYVDDDYKKIVFRLA